MARLLRAAIRLETGLIGSHLSRAQKIAVTGTTGRLGRALVQVLESAQLDVVEWSRPDYDLDNPAAASRLVERDRPDAVVHAAAWTDVDGCARNPDLASRRNAKAVGELAAACAANAIRMGLVSTNEVFDGARTDGQGYRETDPPRPINPYGVSKLAQEMLAERAPLPVVRTRPFNHIGPRQSDAFVTSSFARQIAEIERGVRGPELLVGNLDARRDMMDVRDTARAYEALAQGGVPGRVYNICSGTAHRVGDLLERLLRMARTRVTVRTDPARLRPSDNPVVLGDFSRLEADTGWRPSIPIETTLADLLGWWRERLASMQ